MQKDPLGKSAKAPLISGNQLIKNVAPQVMQKAWRGKGTEVGKR